MKKSLVLAALATALTSGAAFAAAPTQADADSALELLKASVGFKTVQGAGQVPAYAAFLSERLRKAGFPAADILFTPIGETGTLTLTWHGSDKKLKPVLISDHMDVVAAQAKDWDRDPFTAVVENGYVYGRGVYDDKFAVSMVVSTLINLKRDGFQPKRTLVLALSGDEETDMLTAQSLAKRYKDAYLVLNGDAGGGVLADDGSAKVYGLQAGEKTYVDFEISYANAGGHSSRPGRADQNVINRLARATERIAAYDFPPQSNELTLAFLKAGGQSTPGKIGEAMRRFAADPKDAEAAATLSAEPEYIGQVRTTCVATMLNGGHALNALPQRAALTVNCRIFPGVPIAEVQATLARVVDDKDAKFAILGDPLASDASPLRADVMKAIRSAVDANRKGVPIVPSMSSGASDSLYFRAAGVPSYGVSALFMNPADDFAHGKNERVPVAAIPGALRQWQRLLTDITAQ